MKPRKPRFPAQVLPGPTPGKPNAIAPRPGPAPLELPPAPQPASLALHAHTPASSARSLRESGNAAAAHIPNQDAARLRMTQRLAALPGMHPAVLQAMQEVPRHAFIDTALIAKAHEENSLPIGFGQTISKPSVVARMLSLALQAPCVPAGATRIPMRVLEIGTGCGYQAAVMSRIATEVYSIERVRGLHERARENLRPWRVHNLHLLFGDGMLGYAPGAPYAAIISAAGGDAIPQAWIDQLAIGGRIIAPTSTAGGPQQLMLLEKTASGLRQHALEAVHFVPLKSGTN